jgi:pyruvate,water dikinase
VLGENYVHLCLRLGYHFTVVDASVGSTPHNNYVFFRFLGGVTDISRRSRRVALLTCILEKIGFTADARGDLVIARISNLGQGQALEALVLIGKLIWFTRQLDVALKNDGDIDVYCQKFMDTAQAA